MKAIIPVAGIGTRMRPHTHTQPKVLLQVADKPMLDHILDDLVGAGITGVTLIIGHLGERIVEHIRKGYPNLELNFVEQKEMLGLGHAISLAKEFHKDDERLLIILGDTIVQMDFKGLFALPCGSLAVKEVDDPRRFGTVDLKDGRIVKLIEKAENPPTNLAIVGVYLIDRPAMLFEGLDHIISKNIRTKNEFQLTDALQYMIEKGDEMRPYPIEGWLDCGKPETLLETNRLLLERHCTPAVAARYRERFPHSVIVPPVFIGEDSEVKNSIIGPFASIGREVEVENSILSDCTVGKGSSIKRLSLKESMIGEQVEATGAGISINLGDHSTLAVG